MLEIPKELRDHVGNGRDLDGKRNKLKTRKYWFRGCRPRESREKKGSRKGSARHSGLKKEICTNRESVSCLSRRS